jgi:hypothetical protein
MAREILPRSRMSICLPPRARQPEVANAPPEIVGRFGLLAGGNLGHVKTDKGDAMYIGGGLLALIILIVLLVWLL